jgi:hypothetical protein
VPEISRFFGIIIRMFMEVGAPHHRPHFHAAYQNAKGVFALDPIECIGGDLPRTQQRLVEAWAEIHLESSCRTGNSCNPASPPSRSSHCGEEEERQHESRHSSRGKI